MFTAAILFSDENECLMQTHNCNSFANCTNTVGSYECSCWYGYDGDGLNCNGIESSNFHAWLLTSYVHA